MTVSERIKKLQNLMTQKNIDAYIVPTADFHQSEYVGEYFKARKYITGFTGSAGTAVITKDCAYLWTDGRYFIQAAKELLESGVKLMKMGEPDVPSIEGFLSNILPVNGTLAFDGRTVSMGEGQTYAALAASKNGHVIYDCDFIDMLWEDRPSIPCEPVFSLAMQYAGESAASKLTRIREKMKEAGASMHIVTSLDDICWTLNIRGNDIDFFPLVLSYAIITLDKVDLYIDENKLSADLKTLLAKDHVRLRPYNAIYEDVKKLRLERLLIDPARLNYALYSNLPKDAVKIEGTTPAYLMKCIKNPVEIENIKNAQLKDSIAHVRFMKWLKENYAKTEITEIEASDKLDAFRAQMEGFIHPSFGPISAYGAHAASAHYSATPETNSVLKAGNFLLTDTGGRYYEGSTDITRTYALGEIAPKLKEHFTIVLMSNLRLADAKFLYGASGMNLDILARKPFWDRGLNYNHGTGHGVGYLLNIHEGPASFRWQYRPGEVYPFEEGMIITDEPGIYIEDSHGIRLENELLAHKGAATEYGQFMYFETITFIPFDLDAVDVSILSEEDKQLLNQYHKNVFEKLTPYLTKEECEWLANYTRAV